MQSLFAQMKSHRGVRLLLACRNLAAPGDQPSRSLIVRLHQRDLVLLCPSGKTRATGFRCPLMFLETWASCPSRIAMASASQVSNLSNSVPLFSTSVD